MGVPPPLSLSLSSPFLRFHLRLSSIAADTNKLILKLDSTEKDYQQKAEFMFKRNI